MIDEQLTSRIIKAFYTVYNSLGHGFLERIYHNAMIIQLVSDGLVIETQKPIAVLYGENVIGTFSADLVVDEKVIVELKAKEGLHEAHEAQLTNYLRATDLEIGLLFNFGKQPEFKRKYFSNRNKRRSKHETDNILQSLLVENPPKSA
ncbi:MAG: GxxExxY protein [Acidobacteriota bacterium]